MFEALLVVAVGAVFALYRRERKLRRRERAERKDAEWKLECQSEIMQMMARDLEAAGVVKATRMVLPKRVWS